jgi:mono/diheme cytochrome c family protein
MKPVLRNSLSTLFLLSALSICHAAIADEKEITDPIAHGEQLHNANCVKCHTDSVYTRENHFIKSIDALHQQVNRCKDMNGLAWFDEDTDAVVQFLNKKYYRF